MKQGAGRKKIQDALIELMKTKRFQNITIADIVRVANVNRATYYYYYYSKDEVLQDIFDDIMGSINILYANASYTTEENIKHTNEAFLKYVLEKQNTFKGIFMSDKEEEFSKIYHDCFINVYLSEEHIPNMDMEQSSFLLEYLCSGNYQLIKTWVLGDCMISFEKVLAFCVSLSKLIIP